MPNTNNISPKHFLKGTFKKGFKNLPKKEKEVFHEDLATNLKNRLTNKLEILKPTGAHVTKKEQGFWNKAISKISNLKIDFGEVEKMSMKEVVEKYVIAELDSKIQDKVMVAFKKEENSNVTTVLGIDGDLSNLPMVLKEKRRTQLAEVVRIFDLDATIKERLESKNIDWENVSAIDFDDYANRNDLLGIAGFARLTGSNFELIETLKEEGIISPDEVIKWEAKDWKSRLNKNMLPEGLNKEDYAEDLRLGIEQSFPTAYFIDRIVDRDFTEEFELIEKQQLNDKRLAFNNTFNHLIKDDKKEWLDATETKERLRHFKTFHQNNPTLNLLEADFMKVSDEFDWQGVCEDKDKESILAQMRALQRVHVLADTYQVREGLLKSGFDTAHKIIEKPLNIFIGKSKLSTSEARKVYKAAGNMAAHTAHFAEAARSYLLGAQNTLRVQNNNTKAVYNDLKEIAGFEELFGDQDFCACKHCRSIFSSAAYFSDLMRFAEKHASSNLPNAAQIHLKNRRPDLWSLPLTCENTNKEIPYLQVVNEVMEEFIKTDKKVDDAYPLLQTAHTSTMLPRHLSLEQIRVLLGHFDMSLYDLYEQLGVDKEKQLQEKLELSDVELEVIEGLHDDKILQRFGGKSVADLKEFNVQEFIEYARITRKELDQLLKTGFGKVSQNIKVVKKTDNSDIQKWEEVLEGLTEANLALIQSYLTLWRKTNWSILEFDLVLNVILTDDFKIQKVDVEQLARLILIQEKLDLTVEQLVVMLTNIPKKEVEENRGNLFDRLFDYEKLFGKKRIPHTIGESRVLMGLPFEKVISSLISGLAIDESSLIVLKDFFEFDDQTSMTKINVAKFYRYVLVARGLGWSAQELVYACQLLTLGKDIKDDLGDYFQLFELANWLKESPFSMEDLCFTLKSQGDINYTWSQEQITERIQGIQKAIPIPQFEQLTPAPSTAEQKKIKIEIAKKRQELLPNMVKSIFGFQDSVFDQILTNGFNRKFDAPSLKNLFKNENIIPAPAVSYLTNLMNEFRYLEFVLDKLSFSKEGKEFLVSNAEEIFDVRNFKSFSFENLRTLLNYSELVNTVDEEKELQATLNEFVSTGDNIFNKTSLEFFVSNWEQPITRLSSVQTLLPDTPLIAATEMRKLSELSALLSLNGEQLLNIKNNDGSYEDLKNIQDIISAAFNSKYTEEEKRNEKLEPYIDKINTIKRDALADFIMGQSEYEFKDLNDLYAYFLLDVEMSGCFRTSKIRAAISSLQLYVHRCISNLEQSKTDKSIRVSPRSIPQEEWEWRKNYRVWEANRKVFLYPENYIEPDLRGNKSHLFKELEEELLQEDVTLETAEAAYKKYMTGFVELAKLRYAGAYYHEAKEFTIVDIGNWAEIKEPAFFSYTSPTAALSNLITNASTANLVKNNNGLYYLFARTHTDPYQYFYRTYKDQEGGEGIWSNWMKMGVAIEAEEISALIYMGKLYVFWTEVQRKEVTKIEKGTSSSNGAIFKVFTKYAFLKEDGQWSVPQRVYLDERFVETDTIFNRVETKIWSDEEKEKKYDRIVGKFENEVFKKPYAYINYAEATPKLNIALLWTEKQGIRNKKFILREQLIVERINSRKSWSIYLDRIVIPKKDQAFPFSFSMSINVEKRKKWDVKNYKGIAEFTIDLNEPNFFNVNVEILIPGNDLSFGGTTNPKFNYKFPLGYMVSSPNDYAKTYELSLNKSEVLSSNYLSIGSNDLNKELNSTFINGQPFNRHIENGRIDFAKSNKLISQFDDTNQVEIYLPRGSNIQSSTILTDELSEILFSKGLESLLSSQTQNLVNQDGQDFKNDSYKIYYWELFFHIPFLIANHLNANQKFKEAEWWYQRIFNPTNASDNTDSYWEFSRFKNLNIDTLKETITNDTALKTYKKDPFDPHAIARLRPNAYQKAIVMKYIDNLTDWGDYLFTRDTRESIGEAMQRYILAKDILGKRPTQLGDCEMAKENMTYKDLKFESDFLANVENYVWQIRQELEYEFKPMRSSKFLEALSLSDIKLELPTIEELLGIKEKVGIKKREDILFPISDGGVSIDNTVINSGAPLMAGMNNISNFNNRMLFSSNTSFRKARWIENYTDNGIRVLEPAIKPLFIIDWVLERNLAFCIPNNAELLGYWDRVADRMYKIRHCMNISGIRRSLALYEPPIDPALLVRAMAAGLSLQDVQDALFGSTNQPHYRFSYLIEKARQYTQVVQGFGNSLLSALEKKDGEELMLLRSVHEQNILKMTKRIKLQQLKESQVALKNMEETKRNVENRLEHYEGLIEQGLNPWEETQQYLRHSANIIQGGVPLYYGLAQIGSFFRGVFGFSNSTPGENISESNRDSALTQSGIVQGLQAIASSAGILGSNNRRKQDWQFQKRTAKLELKGIEQQLIMSEIRIQIAEKDLETHENQMKQAKELSDFYKGKFTNLGLYDFMASNLNRLYRQAYNLAYDMAKQAERAFELEQNQQGQFYIEGNNWDAGRAGLVAGDRLLIQLMELEKAYMEKNKRRQEITQTFSVLQLSPEALLNLRQKGTCTFSIPQLAFEMAYPGQFKRLIKSVRVTIPSIVGPYTNVSAKLTMINSKIEIGKKLEERQVGKDQSISLSGALNDAGVFELNYRDERYLPFEEAGAISEWQLELPRNFRAFNYDTISDVLMTVSYTSEQGDAEKAEDELKRLSELLKGQEYSRLISLKYDFPNAYHKLLNSKNGQPQKAEFELTKEHFPILFQSRNLEIKKTTVYLQSKKEDEIDFPTDFSVNGNKVENGVVQKLKGSPIGVWRLEAEVDGFNKDELADILILILNEGK